MTPLVLLPGMNCTADLWRDCGVDDALTPELTEPTIAGQVDRLLADLPSSFVIGGLSLGAIVAMALATRAPERVAGLVLVSTNAKAPTPAQRDGWRDWLARLDSGETPKSLQRSILTGLLSPAAAVDETTIARTLAMGVATTPAVLRAQLEMQATRVDLRPGLRELGVPALVVAGLDDVICPPAFHVEIGAAMSHARVVTLDGGHLLPLEQPQRFGTLVRAWRERRAFRLSGV